MRARLAAAGVVALVTALLFWPVFEGLVTGTPRWFEWDVPEQYWPDLVYACEALHDGALPLWNPYDRAGYPYYADPQAATYHPTTWAICALSSSPSLGWATARVILGFFLAGAFGLLWLRRLDVPWSGAIVGAVVIEAAPFMRHNWELNLTGALAYLPLMLWAADRAVIERGARDGLLLGLAVALCAWMGSPPALWLSATFVAFYAAGRLAGQAKAHRVALAQGLGALALGGLVAAGLSAVVIAPGLRLAEHSVQAATDYASISHDALTPDRLLALVWPRPGNHLYLGLLPLGLGAVAVARRRPLAIGMLAMVVVAVLMALGDHGPLFRLAFEWVPGVRMFRLPYRYEAWMGPAAGALAALGLDALDRFGEEPPGDGETRSRGDGGRDPSARARDAGAPSSAPRHVFSRRVLTGLATGLAGLGLPLAVLLSAPSVGLLCLGVAALLIAWRTRTLAHPALGAALALLVLADVSTTLPPDRHMRSDPPPGDPATAARVLAEAPGDARVMDEFAIGLRSGTRLRRPELRGYQDPLSLQAFERVMASLRETPALAAQYGVRFALQGPHYIHGWDRHFLPPPEELRRMSGAIPRAHGVTELTRAMPFAYWVDGRAVERATDRRAALERVRGVAPAPIAVLDGAVWPEGSAWPERPPGPAPVLPPRGGGQIIVAATDVLLERDALSFAIDAPHDGVVVVSEAFYPGWEATVDGVAVPVFRANALVRAVPVEAGAHHVTMRFAPPDGAPLRWLALVTLLVALLALALLSLRARLADADRAGSTRRP